MKTWKMRKVIAGTATLAAALIAGPLYAADTVQAPQPSDKMTGEGANATTHSTAPATPEKPSSSEKITGTPGADTSVTGVKPGPDSSSTASDNNAASDKPKAKSGKGTPARKPAQGTQGTQGAQGNSGAPGAPR